MERDCFHNKKFLLPFIPSKGWPNSILFYPVIALFLFRYSPVNSQIYSVELNIKLILIQAERGYLPDPFLIRHFQFNSLCTNLPDCKPIPVRYYQFPVFPLLAKVEFVHTNHLTRSNITEGGYSISMYSRNITVWLKRIQIFAQS